MEVSPKDLNSTHKLNVLSNVVSDQTATVTPKEGENLFCVSCDYFIKIHCLKRCTFMMTARTSSGFIEL